MLLGGRDVLLWREHDPLAAAIGASALATPIVSAVARANAAVVIRPNLCLKLVVGRDEAAEVAVGT
jgi:hypothetical protein